MAKKLSATFEQSSCVCFCGQTAQGGVALPCNFQLGVALIYHARQHLGYRFWPETGQCIRMSQALRLGIVSRLLRQRHYPPRWGWTMRKGLAFKRFLMDTFRLPKLGQIGISSLSEGRDYKRECSEGKLDFILLKY